MGEDSIDFAGNAQRSLVEAGSGPGTATTPSRGRHPHAVVEPCVTTERGDCGGAVAAAERVDRQLMRRMAGGSIPAFEELYDRYGSRAYCVARKICRDEHRAEEAVQEGFTSVWRNRKSYQPDRGAPAAWLLTLTRNRAIDVARRHGNHAKHRAGEDAIESQRAPGDVAERAVTLADAAAVRARLHALPHTQKEVIALAFYGQLTHSEIATELDIPSGTVKGRMRLGLQKLRTSTMQAVG